MARIEISLDEYNGMLDKISILEKENVEIRKQNELLYQKVEEMTDSIENVYNSGFFERLFIWNNNIIPMLKKYIK